MSSRRPLHVRTQRASPASMVSDTALRNTRSSRAVAPAASATVADSTADASGEPRRILRLTLKMPSSKLREATSGNARGEESSRRAVNVFSETPIISGPRNSRSKKKIVEVDTSEDDDIDDQEEDEVEDEDVPGEDDDEFDADGDVDMDDLPPQPAVSKRHAKPPTASRSRSNKVVKSVEAKEMELEEGGREDDEELSELESDAEGELDDRDQSALPDDMLDANGEEELDEEDEEDEIDSEGPTPATASRASTPDYSRLTKRQRGSLGNDFLQLPMGELSFTSFVSFRLRLLSSCLDPELNCRQNRKSRST